MACNSPVVVVLVVQGMRDSQHILQAASSAKVQRQQLLQQISEYHQTHAARNNQFQRSTATMGR